MDATGDGKVELADVLFFLGAYLFGAAETVACPDALDADDDGHHTLSDVLFMLRFLFQEPLNRPSPKDPFPGCDIDPTFDVLDKFASNNGDIELDPNLRDPALGSCVYPEESCP